MERPTAKRGDWDAEEMPRRRGHLTLKRHFSPEETDKLRHGHIPQEMEDKWFWFMEGDTLYAHRSWTGICIYVIEFDFEKDRHWVTVNHDKTQYTHGSADEEKATVNRLLDWWVRPSYDHYNEWLEETVTAIERNKES